MPRTTAQNAVLALAHLTRGLITFEALQARTGLTEGALWFALIDLQRAGQAVVLKTGGQTLIGRK